jgi:hypothetical protein
MNKLKDFFQVPTNEELLQNEILSAYKDLNHLINKVDSETLVEIKKDITTMINNHIERRIANAEHELDVLSIHSLKEN